MTDDSYGEGRDSWIKVQGGWMVPKQTEHGTLYDFMEEERIIVRDRVFDTRVEPTDHIVIDHLSEEIPPKTLDAMAARIEDRVAEIRREAETPEAQARILAIQMEGADAVTSAWQQKRAASNGVLNNEGAGNVPEVDL